MFKFVPSKIVKQFEAGGDLITLRYPKMKDVRGAMTFINALLEERARIRMSKKVTLREERKWLKGLTNDIKQGMKISLVIEARGSQVGSVALVRRAKPPSPIDHWAEFGIALAKQFRHRGIAERASRALFRLGKSLWKLKFVRSTYDADNVASATLHRKLGFKIITRIPRGAKYNNKYIDEISLVKDLN
jgi:RimJ/RimL family protein N-acetyltransferase